MIAPLRRAHRLAWLGLTPLGFGLIGLAVSQRPAAAVVDTLPPGLGPPAAPLEGPTTAVEGLPVRVVVGGPGRRATLRYDQPLRSPDVLLYWSPTIEGEGVPAGARLLGPLVGRGVEGVDLPADEGFLLFYSLAHAERLGFVALGGAR